MYAKARPFLLSLSMLLVGLSGCAGMNSHRLFNSDWFGDTLKNGQAFDPRAREIEQRLGLSQELGYEGRASDVDR